MLFAFERVSVLLSPKAKEYLSKLSSDLKQNGTQDLTHNFLAQFFNTLSHGVILFVPRDLQQNGAHKGQKVRTKKLQESYRPKHEMYPYKNRF